MTSSSQGDEGWQDRAGRGLQEVTKLGCIQIKARPLGSPLACCLLCGPQFLHLRKKKHPLGAFSGRGGTFWTPHSRSENLELENMIFALFCCLPICKACNLPHPSTGLLFGTYRKFLQGPPVGFDCPASIPSFHNSTSIFLGETFLPCLVHVVWVGL